MNRTLLDEARSMIYDSGVSKNIWAEAIATAAYLNNRSPKRTFNNKTLFKLWTRSKLDLSHLRTFRCETHALIPSDKITKIDLRTLKCIFVGYPINKAGNKLWNPNTYEMFVTRDVIFSEPEATTTPSTVFLPVFNDEDEIQDKVKNEDNLDDDMV